MDSIMTYYIYLSRTGSNDNKEISTHLCTFKTIAGYQMQYSVMRTSYICAGDETGRFYDLPVESHAI